MQTLDEASVGAVYVPRKEIVGRLFAAGHHYRCVRVLVRRRDEKVSVLDTDDGREAVRQLLSAAWQWQVEARRRVVMLGGEPIDRPNYGPWKSEAILTGAKSRIRRRRGRFMRAAHNYAWALWMGWEEKDAASQLLIAAKRLPLPNEVMERKQRKKASGGKAVAPV